MKFYINHQESNQLVGKSYFEVPNTTIAGGAVVLAVIQALSTLLGIYVGNFQKQQIDRDQGVLNRKNFEVQQLQKVLQLDDSLARANSIKILVASDLISDHSGKLLEIAKIPSNVPRWNKVTTQTKDSTQLNELHKTP